MKLTTVFSILLAVTFFACKSFRHKGVFQGDAVPGWLVDSTPKDQRQYLKMWAPNVSINHPGDENIIIAVYPTSVNEDEFAANTNQMVKKKMYSIRNLGKGKLQVGEYDFTWVRYAARPKSEGDEAEQMVYYLSRDNNMYMLTCTSLIGRMDGLQPKIDAVLNSFKAL